MAHVLAPAKVNLHLRILGRRSDGLHEIETVFQKVRLFDEVEISAAPRDELVIAECPWPLGSSEKNLAWRALQLLRERAEFPAVRISLWKRIPPGAGLGGGSSDAAAVLTGLKSQFSLRLSESELMELGLRLGSDIPFLVSSHTCCLGRGVGEVLTPITHGCGWDLALLYPGIASATALAYRLFDEAPPPSDSATGESLIESLQRGDWDGFRGAVRNDFEATLYSAYPAMRAAAERLRDAGCAPVWPTGSGSTVVGGIRPGQFFKLPNQVGGAILYQAAMLTSLGQAQG